MSNVSEKRIVNILYYNQVMVCSWSFSLISI